MQMQILYCYETEKRNVKRTSNNAPLTIILSDDHCSFTATRTHLGRLHVNSENHFELSICFESNLIVIQGYTDAVSSHLRLQDQCFIRVVVGT